MILTSKTYSVWKVAVSCKEFGIKNVYRNVRWWSFQRSSYYSNPSNWLWLIIFSISIYFDIPYDWIEIWNQYIFNYFMFKWDQTLLWWVNGSSNWIFTRKLLSNMSYKVIVNVNVSSLLYVNKSVKQETDDSSLNSSFSLSLSLSLSLVIYLSIWPI